MSGIPHRKRSRAADDREERLYQCAAVLFRTKGYHATTMDDIAEAIDLTKAGLYYYTQSKQDLLYRILDYGMGLIESTVIAPIAQLTDPEERACQFIRRHVQTLIEHELAISVLTRDTRYLAQEHREDILTRIAAYNEFARDFTQQLSDQGKLRELNVTVAAKHIICVILEISRWYPHVAETSVDEIIDNTTTFVMGGLLKPRDR